MTSYPSYRGQSIWIIGASSGIGAALASTLAARGAQLILSSRQQAALERLNHRLGGGHQVLPVDVADADSLVQAVKEIKQVDSVIFMAAIYAPDAANTQGIHAIGEMISVNLNGAFYTVHAVLPRLKQQGFGQIALCASIAGYRGLPYSQPYAATKAALINYGESLHLELAKHNIDVKVINPGFVETPMTAKNDFAMPMMISAQAAATTIANQLTKNHFEIHFPKRASLTLKLLAALPYRLYFYLARRIKDTQGELN